MKQVKAIIQLDFTKERIKAILPEESGRPIQVVLDKHSKYYFMFPASNPHLKWYLKIVISSDEFTIIMEKDYEDTD